MIFKTQREARAARKGYRCRRGEDMMILPAVTYRVVEWEAQGRREHRA